MTQRRGGKAEEEEGYNDEEGGGYNDNEERHTEEQEGGGYNDGKEELGHSDEEEGEEYNKEGVVTRTRTEVDTSNPTTSARLCAAYFLFSFHSIPFHIITHNPRSTPPRGQYIYLLINV